MCYLYDYDISDIRNFELEIAIDLLANKLN